MEWFDEVNQEMTVKEIHKNLTETVSDSETDEIVTEAIGRIAAVESENYELIDEELRDTYFSKKKDLERVLKERPLLDTYYLLHAVSKKHLAKIAVAVPDALTKKIEELAKVHSRVRPFLTKFAERWREENS